ncbi:polyprenol monophosphomannose synthase [uncultured Cellulomonas sp.]|uniref:polyprenol monophosphomannose synthase n=1 Tax=uncultured Cellulomonas sp. TaxID=189682 RepID=UPI002606B759|nr:polyprenol monophosphomannose synthase [uncultured Cellulomonas sp.]
MATTDGPRDEGTATGAGVLVVIPTYDERENIDAVVGRVRAATPHAHVLVVDDNSPDGTGDLADALAASDPQVFVLHRAGKEGLGAAYLAGFAWAFERDYAAVVEMDADGSHLPEQLPDLLAAVGARAADVVLGSRWVPGGSVVNWPVHRKLLSRAGSLYARLMCGLHVADATGGYRVYRSEQLRELVADGVDSQGYCFQIDLVRRSVQAGLRVVEVPITFVERERGQSKMNRSIVLEAVVRVTRWGLERMAPARRHGDSPVPARAGG